MWRIQLTQPLPALFVQPSYMLFCSEGRVSQMRSVETLAVKSYDLLKREGNLGKVWSLIGLDCATTDSSAASHIGKPWPWLGCYQDI